MEPGHSLQYKIQGILKKINKEELRNKVTNWQKIFLQASSRFSFDQPSSSTDTPEEKTDEANLNEDFQETRSNGKSVIEVLPDEENVLKSEDKMEGDTISDLKLLSPVEDHPPRNKSPVQLWIDSLPLDESSRREEEMPPITDSLADTTDAEVENFTLGAEAPGVTSPRLYPTVHITNTCGGSDAGSHCSSMESLLEARRPDPEELLLELGFGGSEEPDVMSRIPLRFLQPSKLKGVSIDDFLRHQQHMVNTFQSGSSGYRGLTGPSHAMPSGIVGKIMDRLREAEAERQHHQHQQYQQQYQHQLLHRRQYAGLQPGYSPKLARLAHNLINKIKCVKEVSVLSPENRNWYERQGDKSPDPSKKRIIIGQQSFSFSKDGILIESSNKDISKDTSYNNSSKMEEDEKKEMSINCEISESNEMKSNKSDEIDQDNGRKSPFIPTNGQSTPLKYPEADNHSELEGTSHSKSTHSTSISSTPFPVLCTPIGPSVEHEHLEMEYKSLASLAAQINGTESGFSIGTLQDFSTLTPEERKCLHVGIIQAALATYQKRLKELDLRTNLKDLLDGQLHKVTDLLDSSTSPSVVMIIKQMTCLLRHQESLKQALDLQEDSQPASTEAGVPCQYLK